MKEQITLSGKEAEEMAADFFAWAEVLESDNSLIEWQDDMRRYGNKLRDKVAGRIE